jgi:hypothetical protein
MLTKVKASRRNPYNNAVDRSVEFSMDTTSPYIVKDISGLGPVKAEVSRSQNSLDRGTTFQSTRTGERNIVIRLGFKPGVAVDVQREALTDVYMPGTKIELEFTTTNLGVLTIQGIVETNEPEIFTNKPASAISIICNDPYFKGKDQVVVYKPNPADFPVFSVPFEGKVPVGFKFEFTMLDAVEQVALFKLPYDIQSALVLNFPVKKDDIIRFNTAKGSRSAEYVRSSATNNALAYFEGSLVAMKLEPGLNWFRFNDYGRSKDIKFTYEKLIGSI